jgi:hypothetical protein
MRVSKSPSSPDEDVRELIAGWSGPLMILLTRTVRRPEIAYDIAAEALARARQEWPPGDAPSLVGDTMENRTGAGVAWLVGIAATVLREAAETGVVPSVERRGGGAVQTRRLSRAHQQELIALTEHATELPDAASAAAAALARDAPQPSTLAQLRLSDLVDAELVSEEVHGQRDR